MDYINNKFRNFISLSDYEFELGILIYKSSQLNDTGWCIKTKNVLSRELGVSIKTIYNILKNLISKGFVEKERCRGYLKCTDDFINNIKKRKE